MLGSRASPHIRKKILETLFVKPLSANSYPAATVSLPVAILWFKATLFHSVPYGIFWSMAQPVDRLALAKNPATFGVQAAATI
jgi:hypothetical protein